MKSLKGILLLIVFSQLALVGCNNKPTEDTEAIVVSYYSGLGVSHLILGTDSSIIESILENKRPLSVKIDEYADGHEIVADKAAIGYLEEYVAKKCNATDSSVRLLEKIPTFLVTTFTKTGKSICLFNDQKINKDYFKGMLQWIQDSQYKESLKEFTPHIQAIVDAYK